MSERGRLGHLFSCRIGVKPCRCVRSWLVEWTLYLYGLPDLDHGDRDRN